MPCIFFLLTISRINYTRISDICYNSLKNAISILIGVVFNLCNALISVVIFTKLVLINKEYVIFYLSRVYQFFQ